MAQSTVLRTFADELQAQLAQAVLDAHGIPSVVVRDDGGGTMPWLQLLHPVKLLVREDDAAEASRLLDEDVDGETEAEA